ncbi:MAG: hypothetical protein ACOY5B_00535 [Spirochaetota bacterium]
MIPVKLHLYLTAAVPLQLGFGALHFVLSRFSPQNVLLREALPVLYLAVTYLQWLTFSFWISLRTKKYPVPIIMHLPHLLSFLPLVRHIMLSADRQAVDATSLNLAWLHSVVTHSFSLLAAWLWQVRAEFDDGTGLRHRLVPILLYILAALTTLVVYAGLDLSFARSAFPFGLGLVQLLLYTSVTLALLLRERIRHFLPVAAAAAFALVNGLLLFDQARSDIGVEFALAAGSATQLFSLYVFLVYSAHRRAITR